MAAIDDLIAQISDEGLRDRIQKEVERMNKHKKFGLVFEEHKPECTPLYDIKVTVGSNVMQKNDKKMDNIFKVVAIKDGIAYCVKESTEETAEFNIDDIVCVAQFGEPIYPYLKPMDSVCNAPDSDLWHTLIQADNYHALQLLEYLYAGKVDCIYIDPPYNTGARDWKYNNNYVDDSDNYRHSKWLSFMQKRLKIAKKLLNPHDSVLIVTIDEKEYLHLGCLLEEMFPEARIQMISDVINPKGVARSGFSRNDEYIFFVMIGNASPARLPLGNEWSSSASLSNVEKKTTVSKPEWTSMMRRGSNSSRTHSPGCYYPIYVDIEKKVIVEIGEPVPIGKHRGEEKNGLLQVLPIRTNGDEGCWQVSPSELKLRMSQGRIKLGRETDYGCVINYLPDGAYKEILSDAWVIDGYGNNGAIIAHRIADDGDDFRIAPTQWKIASHNASENGSTFIAKILTDKRFTYPKSLYSEYDAIRFFVANKPDALIVDFFAGSGTTLHAVNLLNAEDNGNRRCIMVTNNEVSAEESKDLFEKGYKPGDEEWEKLGIAQYVTWPRTVCSIKGVDVKGNALKGNYIGSDIPMADGFKANANFFKLGFLNKNSVALGMQLKELIPVLWMKANAIGECPIDVDVDKDMIIFPKNKMAILIDENSFSKFKEELDANPKIETAFIITDYEAGYQAMANKLNVKNSYQLYRDYLDNFRINQAR